MVLSNYKKLIAFVLTLVLLISCAPLLGHTVYAAELSNYYVSLKLDGSIQVNLYLKYNNQDGDPSDKAVSLSYPDETVISGKKKTDEYTYAGLATESVSADEADYLGNIDLSGYKKISCRVAPAQINEKIILEKWNGKDWETIKSFTVKEIAKKYVDVFSEKSGDDAAKITNLCKSILSYGDDAYNYFKTQSGYGFLDSKETLSSGGALAESYYNEPLAASAETAFNIIKTSSSAFINAEVSPAAAYTVAGVSFICASNTNVRYSLRIDESEFAASESALEAEMSFTKQNATLAALAGNSADKVNIRFEDLKTSENGFRCYYIRVKNIPAQCLGEEYQVTVKKDGEAVYSFKGSAMAYANKVFNEGFIVENSGSLAGDNSEEKLELEKKMMVSAYRYYEAAIAYFGEFE